MKVLGIVGSLRQRSYNLMALRAAQRLTPPGMKITIADLSEIPLFNQDDRTHGDDPSAVELLKSQVREADAVLFACPEYNYSIPGVLKNSLDWLSLPPDAPFDGKPVAIMGASAGSLGTSRAQYHLRQVLLFMNTFTVNKPEVFIGSAHAKFDEAGELIDAPTEEFIAGLLLSLQALAKRLG
ncbi:NADPH-dependent FMN reductase [Rhizobium sp.]|uniref:NADPH-dependent FMN reductase n=1 Tax=Rhizobium sp. TaxID=391 RepID=UPI002EDFB0D1